ncbi:MAG: TonB-dependent receptor [Gammaproteobacteria bacterium]
MTRKLLAAGIALATTTVSLPAMAQNGVQAIQEIQVTSATRRSEGLAEVNGAVSVISQDELQLIRHDHYQEALNRLPGVSVNRNNGQESLVAIRSPALTGAGACGAFLVAENGIPVRSHGFCNVNEMFDTHSENAQRIEVVRGPASAFWGSNSMHGLINVVLPEPGDAGNVTLETGPRGTYRAQGALGSSNGDFSQLLLLNGINQEGYQVDSGYDQQKASWLYSYDGDNVSLDGGFTFINLNQETAGYVEGTDSYKNSVLRKTNSNPEAYRDSQNFRAWTSIGFNSGEWDMVLTPYYRKVDMNFIQHFLPGSPIEDTEQTSLGAQFAAYTDMANGASLALGVDMEIGDGSLLQFQPNPTAGSAFLQNTIPQGKHYDYDLDMQQTAVFASYEQPLGDDWELSLGLRIENVDYDYDNKMIAGRTKEDGVACGFGGCRYSRPADRSDDFTDVSPKLGLRYALDDNHSLQFRAQRGVRAPQATELYRLQNAQTVADLDSVELDSMEVEFSGAGANWNYSATLFTMKKENEIITDSARANLDGAATDHDGLEVGLGYDFNDRISLATAWTFANHVYANSPDAGSIDITGNEVDTAPDIFGNLRLQWQMTPRLLTELEWVHMGEYFTNPENTALYDGHDLFNLRARYQLDDSISFSLNVKNLFDKAYAERADWTTFSGDRYFVGEEARVYAAVTWNFR